MVENWKKSEEFNLTMTKQFYNTILDRAVGGVVPGLEDQVLLNDQCILHF